MGTNLTRTETHDMARKNRTRRPSSYDHGPEHRRVTVRTPDGAVLRASDIVLVDAPDPSMPNTTIRRARVRDPVRSMVISGAPYRILLAAEAFRLDIERAASCKVPSQLRPRIAGGQVGDAEPTRALAAQGRVAAAWQAIGLTHTGVVSWCVVPKPTSTGQTFGTLDGYAECKGIRRQRASDLLHEGLVRLADHYGLGDSDTPRELRLTREG